MAPFKGDLSSMKDYNRRLILNTIRKKGSLSRAEIAKQTELNPSTVTRIVADLINEGFLHEIGYANSQGGRKPILIDLVPNAVHIIGINVETTMILGIVANLTGDILYKTKTQLQSHKKDVIAQVIIDTANNLINQAATDKRSIIGIGVAMHGLVDVNQGVALYPPGFGWKNLPIVSILEEHFNIPVRLENNARAMALGEWWFGAGRNLNDFIVLKIGYGIGSGIILNGQIFRGIDFTAGEIGHTTVTIDGPLCDCGNYGCLEALASVKALIKKAQRCLKEGYSSKILTLAGLVDSVQPEHIFQAAAENDALAVQLLQDIGRYIGIALASLANLLNPAKILLGGDILPGLDYILPTLIETVQTRAMEIPAKRLAIQQIMLGEYAASIGAVTLILENIFMPTDS